MELRGYQLAGVDFLRGVGRCILADAMGVGKTPQLIRAAIGDTLVVAPPGLHSNWRNEIQRWATGDALFQISSYHGLVDMKQKDSKGHVLGLPKSQFRHPWDTLIFDEAHHLKGRHTGYARAGVQHLAPKADQLFMATGTPIRNWAYEIFMLLRAIYPGDKRFTSFWRWVDQWFTVSDQVTYFKGKRQKHQHIGDLRDITDWDTFVERNGLEGRVLRRTLDSPEVDIDLPPMLEIVRYCDMGPTQKKAYRDMERKFFATFEGKAITSTSTGSQWTNLMRLASGLYFHPDFLNGPSAKLDALDDLLEDLGDEQLIIFAHYHETIDGLVYWLDGLAVGCHGGMSAKAQEEARQRFKSGDVQILVGSYGTLSEGHNLTEANKVVLFEHSPVPALEDQAVKRIHRFGQTEKCTVWSLVTTDTTEQYYVDKLLPAKRDQADGLVTAAELRSYLGR